MNNQDIRTEITKSGLKYWQVADGLGITDGNFSRLLRRELPEEKKQQIRAVITEMKGAEN